jgi:hypothetical protein
MRSRLVWPAAFSAALVLADCGGHAVSRPPAPPRIPRTVAASLARQADALASRLTDGNACSARPQVVAFRRAALVALPRVPTRYRATLSKAVDQLASRVPTCPPPAPPPPPKPKPAKPHEHKGKGGKGHHEH